MPDKNKKNIFYGILRVMLMKYHFHGIGGLIIPPAGCGVILCRNGWFEYNPSIQRFNSILFSRIFGCFSPEVTE